MPSSGRRAVLELAEVDLLRPAPFRIERHLPRAGDLGKVACSPGSSPPPRRGPTRPPVRKTTNQLCRGANARGTAVRRSRRHSAGRGSRRSPRPTTPAASRSVRKTASTVAAVRRQVGQEVDVGLAGAAVDPVEPGVCWVRAKLDVRRQAVGLHHSSSERPRSLGPRRSCSPAWQRSTPTDVGKVLHLLVALRIAGQPGAWLGLAPTTVTPFSASSLTLAARGGDTPGAAVRQHQVAIAHAVGQDQPAVFRSGPGQQHLGIEHVVVEAGGRAGCCLSRGAMKPGIASSCK